MDTKINRPETKQPSNLCQLANEAQKLAEAAARVRRVVEDHVHNAVGEPSGADGTPDPGKAPADTRGLYGVICDSHNQITSHLSAIDEEIERL